MASGNTIDNFTPHSSEPPATNYATFDTRGGHLVLDFDGATNESIYFTGIVPRHYAGGGLTVYIHYSMTSDITNDIDWDVAFERTGDQQLDVDSSPSFAAVQSVDGTTVPGTTGFVDIVNIAFTDGAQMDSIAVGEKYRIEVTRDAASDTSTTDAELHAVELKET